MKGGAIPLLAWGLLLTVLFVANAVWDARFVNAATAAFAALVVFAAAALVVLRSGRTALRRGAPAPSSEPQAVPHASAGAALAALGLASIVFGFTFGKFLVYFGAALLAAALSRIVLELRAERRDRNRAAREHRP